MSVLTTIGDLDAPVESIQFPSITVCPESGTKVDRMAFIEEIFNKVRYVCPEQANCSQVDIKGREHFSDLLSYKYDTFKNETRKALHDASLEDLKKILIRYKPDYRLGPIAKVALSNLNMSRSIREQAQREVRTMMGTKIFMDIYYQVINPLLSTFDNSSYLPDNPDWSERHDLFREDKPDIQACTKDEACSKELAEWYKFFIIAQQVFPSHSSRNPGLGTILANFLQLLGDSFGVSQFWPLMHHPMKLRETEVHELFSKILTQLTDGAVNNVSLVDIPSLLSIGTVASPVFLIRQAVYSTEHSKDCNTEALADLVKKLQRRKNSYSNLCSGSNSSPCCHHWGKILAKRFDITMMVMRMSLPQGQFHKNIDNLGTFLHNWTILQKYDLLDEVERSQQHLLPLIPVCKTNERRFSTCNSFKPILTATGVCHSYNGISAQEMYRATPYLKTFSKVYDVKPMEEVQTVKGFGIDQGVTFILDSNRKTRPSHYIRGMRTQETSKFKILLGSKYKTFDTRKHGIYVKSGQHLVLKVSLSQLTGSNDLRQLSIEQRKCRFMDENDGMEFMKYYTQAGCYHQCQLKHSAEACGCTPWNYIQAGNVEEICDMFGNACFEGHMNDANVIQHCKCDNDCEKITFHFSESVTALR